jgi:4-amino-4-deoxy-L-arabinose transferase-like glycosyltransferase
MRGLLRAHRAVIAALLVALLLRLVWLGLHHADPPRGDDKAYVNLAHSLLEGRGYTSNGNPITHYMPGWPLLLAMPLGLGLGMLGAKLLVVLLSTVLCLEAYLLGERLVSRRAGLAAAWFGAVFPPLIWYSDILLSETASATVVGLWCLVAIGYVRNGGLWRTLGLGLMTAVLIYFRAELFVLVPMPFAARALLPGTPKAREVGGGLLVIVLTLAALAPWALYNQHRLGKAVWLTSAGGIALWVVAHDPPVPDFQGPEFTAGSNRLSVPGHPEQTGARFGAEAKVLLRQHPGAYLRARLLDLPRFWLGSQTEVTPGAEVAASEALRTRDLQAVALKAIGYFSQICLVLGLVVGLLLFARRRELLLVWMIIVAKEGIHAPLMQSTRYSLHLAPLTLCFAGASLVWALDRLRFRRGAVSATRR